MDDSKFGGITGSLTKGVVLQKYRDATSDFDHIWNVKSNSEVAGLGYDFFYTTAAPSGSYGARFRISYGGPSKHGVTLRLESSDYLVIFVQDDLTPLEKFTVVAQGHVVE
jgi:hypothetical protein